MISINWFLKKTSSQFGSYLELNLICVLEWLLCDCENIKICIQRYGMKNAVKWFQLVHDSSYGTNSPVKLAQ